MLKFNILDHIYLIKCIKEENYVIMIITILPLIFDFLDNPFELLKTCKTVKNSKYRISFRQYNCPHLVKLIVALKTYKFKFLSTFIQNIVCQDGKLFSGIETLEINGEDIPLSEMSDIKKLYIVCGEYILT